LLDASNEGALSFNAAKTSDANLLRQVIGADRLMQARKERFSLLAALHLLISRE